MIYSAVDDDEGKKERRFGVSTKFATKSYRVASGYLDPLPFGLQLYDIKISHPVSKKPFGFLLPLALAHTEAKYQKFLFVCPHILTFETGAATT